MKGKAQIKTALVVSVIATAILLGVDRLWGNHISEQVGFALLIGFSYAALRK
jgi:hypothetical protein